MFILHGRPSRGGRLMALACTHSTALPATSRENVAVCDSATCRCCCDRCPPQCRSHNSPPTYASCYGSQPGKLSKIAKGAAAPKLGFASIIWRRRLHWLAAGEPPQYTALVDCRRRWEVRLGLGGGSLGPQIDPRRPEPACDRTIRRRKPSTGITAPATGPPPPQRASCLALLRSLGTAEHCRPATPAQTVENSDSLNCLARRIGGKKV